MSWINFQLWFWSCGHSCGMAAMHLPTKFCANVFIQTRDKFWFLCLPWCLSSVPNLVQISLWLTNFCLWKSTDAVMQINFWFLFVITWSSHGCDAPSHQIGRKYLQKILKKRLKVKRFFKPKTGWAKSAIQ